MATRSQRRAEGLLLECLHPAHEGNRMRPRGWFARNGRGESRHSWCRECRREGKSAQAARRRGAGVKEIPKGWLRKRWISQGGVCAICLQPVFLYHCHVDHRVPVSRGGKHEWSNLWITHPLCNLRKSSKLTS